ncbi:MAG: hypothetical protein V4614_01890 [Pseudomonadota bacterium]
MRPDIRNSSRADCGLSQWLSLAMVVGGLAGCAAPLSAPAPAATMPVPVELPPVAQASPPPSPARVPDNLAAMLAYADRVRPLQGPELAQEISRLGEAATAEDQLRLAIALIQTRQLYDMVRAQEMLQRVLANPASATLHPLARLLAARFAEQRRVEDQLDRQGLQLRDAQRRLDQTNDKLEALKEIERSLTPRPGVSAPPTSSRNRSRTTTQ